jgi:hypothetical protein
MFIVLHARQFHRGNRKARQARVQLLPIGPAFTIEPLCTWRWRSTVPAASMNEEDPWLLMGLVIVDGPPTIVSVFAIRAPAVSVSISVSVTIGWLT